jgi:arginyl-tRNA synthetase
VISADLRHAIARAVAAEGLEPADPGLRPTGTPGRYASSVAFASGEQPRAAAARIAARLAGAEGIARADVTGQGFIAITVTPEALAAVGDRVIAAGPGCAASDALAGVEVAAPPGADPLAEPSWEKARAALALQVTARLAAAAGATAAVLQGVERSVSSPPARRLPVGGEDQVASAVAYAGTDAVRFALARAVPGRPVEIDRQVIARHVLANPAYAVRYAHARAASGVRWAADSRPIAPGRTAVQRHPLAHQAESVLLDALSWLPERVAMAARRGRPDEFARYLEELAGATLAALICTGYPANARGPGTDRLALAARTGLAAGLGLLGVAAPDRL